MSRIVEGYNRSHSVFNGGSDAHRIEGADTIGRSFTESAMTGGGDSQAKDNSPAKDIRTSSGAMRGGSVGNAIQGKPVTALEAPSHYALQSEGIIPGSGSAPRYKAPSRGAYMANPNLMDPLSSNFGGRRSQEQAAVNRAKLDPGRYGLGISKAGPNAPGRRDIDMANYRTYQKGTSMGESPRSVATRVMQVEQNIQPQRAIEGTHTGYGGGFSGTVNAYTGEPTGNTMEAARGFVDSVSSRKEAELKRLTGK